MRPRSQAFFKDVVPAWMNSNGRKISESAGLHFVFIAPSSDLISMQQKHLVRMPLSVEDRVALPLWRLGTTIEYRSLGHLFGVGLSTVCVAIDEVCTTIVDVHRHHYI